MTRKNYNNLYIKCKVTVALHLMVNYGFDYICIPTILLMTLLSTPFLSTLFPMLFTQHNQTVHNQTLLQNLWRPRISYYCNCFL